MKKVIHLLRLPICYNHKCPTINFKGRRNKPNSWNSNASDEINAMFNYGYAILEPQVRRTISSIGLGYKNDSETGKPIIPMLPYISKKIPGTDIPNPDFEIIQYKSFRDYKTGRRYSDDDLRPGQLWTKSYWKPLSMVVCDYIDHPEAKSQGDTGQLTRLTLRINHASIRYVGKETNELEEAEVIGVDPEYYTEYINWKGIIERLTPDDVAKFGISERHLLRLKQKVRDGEPIPLRKMTKAKLLHWYNR